MTLDELLRFDPPVIAHRGASALAPENTMAAFVKAADLGARWIEADGKLTQDNVAIIFHDNTLNRTTGMRGNIADMTWMNLSSQDAGDWFDPEFTGEGIPLLTDLLRLIRDRDLCLNLEIKPCPGRAAETTAILLAEISHFWPQALPPVLVSSFDEEALALVAELRPDWPRGVLLHGWRDNWRETAEKFQAATLHPDAAYLTQARVAELCSYGRPVIPYTVNDAARAAELRQWGCAAVFTDDPRLR